FRSIIFPLSTLSPHGTPLRLPPQTYCCFDLTDATIARTIPENRSSRPLRTEVNKMKTTSWLLTGMLSVAPAFAQWDNVPNKNVARIPDGRPNMSASAPRTADGKPDLSGMWWMPNLGPANTGIPPKYLNNIAADLKPEEVPMQPWAAELFKQRGANFSRDFPYTRCLPSGPMISSFPAPWKVIQAPGLVTILYENSTTYRQIFTDGRVLSKDADPTFMGYSVGHWEGDTFVVETRGYNDKTWLDFSGHPHTDALRMTERYRRTDFGHLEVQFTFDDPKAYTKPWTVTIVPQLYLDGDLLESVCLDNEIDLHRVLGK